MKRSHQRRWLRALIVWGSLLAVIAGLIFWASETVFGQTENVLDSTSFTTVEVVEGEVASEISLNTVAKWAPEPVGTNQAAGVVTSVDAQPGADATQGGLLYTVGLRPVIIAKGDVPAYREIGYGSKGADVKQLQTMLADLGIYHGQSDGEAGLRTVAAIKQWQDSLDLEETGYVSFGDIIFVPRLPSRVVLDTEIISRGATVSGGEIAVLGLPESPTFTVPVSESQASLMPTGTRVEMLSPSQGDWTGYVTEQTKDPDSNSIQVGLSGKDGGVICGDQCAEVPVVGEALLPTRIVTVEPVSGLVVPSAALVTAADGTLAVVDASGTAYPVVQLTSARGMSVITGVDSGLRVRIPGSLGEK